jgi:predicted RNase H-like HicB family nuclease
MLSTARRQEYIEEAARGARKMVNTHYSINIQWDEDDEIYVVSVPELPGCRTHGKTYEEAIRQAQDAIDSWIMVAHELERPVPPPRVRNRYIA